MKIKKDNGYGTTYVFEVVDKAPSNYVVWNVGVDFIGEFIPFCRILPDPEGWRRNVDVSSLVAVRLDKREDREALMQELVPYGVENYAQVKKKLARKQREAVREGLLIAERILGQIQEH